MFKKGQFIRNKGCETVYKIIGIEKSGCDRCYVLRPKGSRSDKYDFDEPVKYVNQEYELINKKLSPLPDDYHDLLWMFQ